MPGSSSDLKGLELGMVLSHHVGTKPEFLQEQKKLLMNELTLQALI